MTRNFLFVQKQYGKQFPDDVAHEKKMLLNRIKNNLLYNKKRLGVAVSIVKGAKDFWFNKY